MIRSLNVIEKFQTSSVSIAYTLCRILQQSFSSGECLAWCHMENGHCFFLVITDRCLHYPYNCHVSNTCNSQFPLLQFSAANDVNQQQQLFESLMTTVLDLLPAICDVPEDVFAGLLTSMDPKVNIPRLHWSGQLLVMPPQWANVRFP